MRERYEFGPAEEVILVEICRLLDSADLLQAAVEREGEVVTGSVGQPRAHPALSELRASRLALGRLLGQLGIPTEAGDALPSPETVRARRAASARWSQSQTGSAVSDAARRAAMARWHGRDTVDGA